MKKLLKKILMSLVLWGAVSDGMCAAGIESAADEVDWKEIVATHKSEYEKDGWQGFLLESAIFRNKLDITTQHKIISQKRQEALDIIDDLDFCMGELVREAFHSGVQDPFMNNIESACFTCKQQNQKQTKIVKDLESQRQLIQMISKSSSKMSPTIFASFLDFEDLLANDSSSLHSHSTNYCQKFWWFLQEVPEFLIHEKKMYERQALFEKRQALFENKEEEEEDLTQNASAAAPSPVLIISKTGFPPSQE